MKKWIFLLLALVTIACNRQADPLFGTWKATKVHVGFDEKYTTPDMVKQVGEMEKENRLDIKSDSTMTFVSNDYKQEGKIKLLSDGKLFCDDELFGIWKDGKIITQTPSPFGEIQVEYTKE